MNRLLLLTVLITPLACWSQTTHQLFVRNYINASMTDKMMNEVIKPHASPFIGYSAQSNRWHLSFDMGHWTSSFNTHIVFTDSLGLVLSKATYKQVHDYYTGGIHAGYNFWQTRSFDAGVELGGRWKYLHMYREVLSSNDGIFLVHQVSGWNGSAVRYKGLNRNVMALDGDVYGEWHFGHWSPKVAVGLSRDVTPVSNNGYSFTNFYVATTIGYNIFKVNTSSDN